MMKIYLDMDGVLADFFSGLEERFNVKHWKQIPKTEESIMGLKGTDFFNQLKPYPTTMELVNFVQTLVGDDKWGICSSPLRGDRDNSAYWKRVWLTRHFIMPDVSNLIFTGRKEQFATDKFDGTPNVLVDDKPDNVSRWIAKGGIGIRYQANQDSLVTLKQKLIGIVEKS
jgi:5'(3')-deoxyribonucleotidase